MLELLNEYLVQEALIVIPVLLILGKIIKETTLIENKYIPVTLLGLGIGFTLFLMGFNVHAVLQGILVAGAAVFSHQLYTQAKDKE